MLNNKKLKTKITTMITKNQLLERVLEGRLILVGEYRNGRFDFRETVDHVSGEKIQCGQYVYAVECGAAFGTVLIYRPHPAPSPDLTVTKPGLEKVSVTPSTSTGWSARAVSSPRTSAIVNRNSWNSITEN